MRTPSPFLISMGLAIDNSNQQLSSSPSKFGPESASRYPILVYTNQEGLEL